jgi:beta-glucosidase
MRTTGCEIYRSLPDLIEGTSAKNGEKGFDVEYFTSFDTTGAPIKSEHVRRSYLTTHDQIDVKETAMSARMTATYQPSESGRHYLSLSGAGVTRLYVDGTLVASQEAAIPDAMAFIAGCQDEVRGRHDFEAGKTYKVEVITTMPDVRISDSPILDKQLCAHVGFVPQGQMERGLLEESVALAREADVAIVFVGNTYQWESEGQDMGAMALPPHDSRAQDGLIAAVAAANPRTVVVANTGVAFETPWLGDVAALVQGWYAGQEVGNALVDVLVGEVNPSGRLPVSWPRRYEDTACFGNYGLDSQESKEVEYVEGVFVGYRHFDRHWGAEGEVLFPFGFGLSYTTFEVKCVSVTGDFSAGISLQVTVRNTGEREGAQTVQVYVVPPQSEGVERPVKELASFEKVHLLVGQEETVQVQLTRDAAAYWDEGVDKWRVVGGEYGIWVATSSRPDDAVAKETMVVEEGFCFEP